jgi:Ribonuclease G/E
LAAIGAAARLLRLKALGGIVVIDLAGRGHDGQALLAAARAAFAPDNPGVAIGPVGRFGTMEISLPRRSRPLIDRLCGADGAPSDRTIGQRLIRRAQTEALAQPGAQLVVHCAPTVAEAIAGPAGQLVALIGARLQIRADPALSRTRFEVAVA